VDNQNYIVTRNSTKGEANEAAHDLDAQVDALHAHVAELEDGIRRHHAASQSGADMTIEDARLHQLIGIQPD
jgi:hypothetical protein